MPQLLADRDAYISAFTDYLQASPSAHHATASIAEALVAAGFEAHDETAPWAALEGGSRGFVRRQGALIAWRAGARVTSTSPVRIVGCHTDSTGFVLKPSPDFSHEGWAQAAVEIYSGPLMASWLDRDLAFAGQLVTRDGVEHLVHTAPVARIPQLAIHLDRGVNDEGVKLDRQRHTQPIIGVGEVSAMQLIADAAGVAAGDIVGTDIRLADTQAPQRIGAHGDLLAAGRLDNLSSTFAGLAALLETEPAEGTISILAAFDHEEIGSASRTGASGPFLAEVLDRLRAGLGAGADEAAQALSASWCISADAGHAVHPNYSERHDPHMHPRAGGGPMLKVNANQRYATDPFGAALWERCAAAADVPTQTFVSNNSVPCGSTIGPLTATRIGIRTVDVGVGLLSMHSVRELAHVDDLHGLARIIGAFFSDSSAEGSASPAAFVRIEA